MQYESGSPEYVHWTPCSLDAQCAGDNVVCKDPAELTNSASTKKRCLCDTGYAYRGGSCKAKVALTQSCSGGKVCEDINAECSGASVCACVSGFTASGSSCVAATTLALDESAGCYKDDLAARVLNQAPTSTISLKLDQCKHYCSQRSYTYAAVQMRMCFCGDFLPTTTGTCDMKCSGEDKTCGGGESVNIVKLRVTNEATTSWVWPFDSISGTQSPASPATTWAILTGSPTNVEGVVGNALRLSGDNGQYTSLRVPGNISCIHEMTTCQGFTFSIYVKITIIPDKDNYIFTTSKSTNEGFELAYMVTDTSLPCRRRFRAAVRTSSKKYAIHFDLNTGDWTHVILTWTPAGGLSVYIDGFLDSTEATGGAASHTSAVTTDGQIVIGRHFTDADHYASMDVDHAKFWLKGFESRPSDISDYKMWKVTTGVTSGTNSSSDVSAAVCRQKCLAGSSCMSASVCREDAGVTCYTSGDSNDLTGSKSTNSNCTIYSLFTPGGPAKALCYKFSDITSAVLQTLSGSVILSNCKKKCNEGNFYYALLTEGSKCYCYKTPPTAAASSSGSCDLTCSDGSKCGSSSGSGYASAYVVTSKRAYTDVTLTSVTLNVTDTLELDLDRNGTVSISMTVNGDARACYSIDFGEGRTNLTELNTVSYAYASVGVFSLKVTAQNSKGSVVKAITVNVYKAVGTLTPNIPAYGALRTSLPLSLSMAAGSNVTCIVSFGDQSSQTYQQIGTSLSIDCPHTYTVLDSKTIQITCSNPISSQVASASVFIQEKLQTFASPAIAHAIKDKDGTLSWSLAAGTHFVVTISVDGSPMNSLTQSFTQKTTQGSIIIPASTLTQYKNYSVVLTANNNVTSPPLTANLAVDVTHAFISSTLAGPSTSEQGKPSMFNVTVTGGYVTVECDFKDGKKKEVTKATGDLVNHVVSITHTFDTGGQFEVTCTSRDDLSSPEIKSTLKVTVQGSIKALAVSKSSISGETNPLKFNILLSASNFGTNVCYLVDFGDANCVFTGPASCKQTPGYSKCTFKETNTTITSFIHEYSKNGAYTIRANGFNALSNETATLTFLVDSQYDCAQPSVKNTELSQSPDSPTPHYKSEPLNVKVTVGPSCTPLMPLTMKWVVQKLDDGSNPLTDITSTSAEINIPQNKFTEFGVYKLQFSVYPEKIASLQNSLTVYVNIKPTPLKVIISGGSPRTFPEDKAIVFEATASIDPDIGSISGISFEWYCKKTNEAFPKDTTGNLITTLPSGASGGCEGKGPGRLTQTTQTLTISANTFPAGTQVSLLLVGKKDTRSTNTSQVAQIIPAGSAEISISCKSTDNCGAQILPHLSLSFEGSCDSCSAADRTSQTYSWELQTGGATVAGFAAMTELGTTNKDVVIKSNALQKSSSYALKLSIGPAFSVHEFTTAAYPGGGSCSSDKSSGITQETKFTITCSGYVLSQGGETVLVLSHRFSYVRQGTTDTPTEFDVVTDSSVQSRPTSLPVGLASSNYLVDIHVDICSKIKACTRTTVSVKVEKTTLSLEGALASATSAFNGLLTSKDTQGMASMISAVSQSLPKVSLIPDDSDDGGGANNGDVEKQLEETRKMKAMFVDALSSTEVTSSNIGLLASSAASLTADMSTVDAESQKKMINMLDSLGNSPSLSPATASVVVTAALSVGADLMVDSSPVDGSVPENSEMSPKEYKAFEEARRASKQEMAREMGEKLKTMMGKALAVSCAALVVGQQNKIDMNGITAIAQPLDTAVTKPISTDDHGGSFEVDFSTLPMIDADKEKTVNAVTMSMSKPLGILDPSLQTGTQSLSLSAPGGGEMNVKGLTTPIQVSIPAPPAGQPVNVTANCSSSLSRVVSAKINITDPAKQIFIFAAPDSPSVIDVYVQIDGAPNVSRADYLQHETLDFTSDMSEKKVVLKSGKTNSTHYIVVFNITCVQDGEVILNYTMLAFGCMYYNKATKAWATNGLQLDVNKTTKSSIACLSFHLTEFGADFFVPPNSIDFSTVFDNLDQKLAENAPVVATVGGIVIIYFILVFILRRLDKKDVVKWATTPLADNTPLDRYHYHVTIFTSSRKGAGTRSNVFFMLAGESDNTEVRKLEDTTKTKVLTRGSVNNYLLSHPRSLGTLLYMRIWHDNSGEGEHASWHLDRVVITDIQSKDKFVFLCDQWMAVDLEDGQLERLLPAASEKDLQNFQLMFYSKTRQDMTDGHLWFSVASRPTRSHFTRVQRLSCCLALLYATMIANAMFFRSDENIKNPSIVKLGPFTFSPQQLSISIISSLVTIPMTLLIITLFRKAGKRPQKRNKTTEKSPQTSPPKSPTPSAKKFDDLTETGDQSIFQLGKSKADLQDDPRRPAEWEEYDNLTKSLVRDPAPADTKGRAKKRNKLWPWWVVIVAYILVGITVFVSAFFTILYSFEWGGVKSSQWLTTFLLSFFQSVVVIQPMKVIATAVILSLIFKRQSDDKDLSLEDDEIFLEEMKDHSCNRDKYVVPEHRVPFVPKEVDQAKLEIMRKRREKELKMFEMLRDLASYMVYVLVLCIVSYDNRDPNAFPVKKEVNSLLVGSSFKSIATRDQFWSWASKVMLPAMYKTEFYNGNRCKWRDRLFMSDRAIVRVGAPRLRQHRVKADTCKVTPSMTGFIKHCYGEYGSSTADKTSYAHKWRSIDLNTSHSDSSWIYRTSSQLSGMPTLGQLSMYSGGGYVAELTSRPFAAQKVISNLSQSDWVDSKTRAVFLEANLFNPNVNLFCIVTLIFELLPLGGATHTVLIKPLRLYNHVGPNVMFRVVVEALFALFTLYFMVVEGRKIRKERMQYFYSFWNVMEVIIIVLSICTCALYGMHYVISRLTLKKFQEDKDVFTNFQFVVYWDDVFGYTLAFVVFLVMIKTLRVLRFNKTVTTLLAALRVASKPLFSFFVFFMVIFCAFAQFSYFLFGTKLLDYKSFITTLESQFNMLLMRFRFEDLRWANPVLGPIFFLFFCIFIAFVVMNMLISIINESFYIIQTNTALIGDDYEVIDLMMERFKKMVGINDYIEKPPDSKIKTPPKPVVQKKMQMLADPSEIFLRQPVQYELYKY